MEKAICRILQLFLSLLFSYAWRAREVCLSAWRAGNACTAAPAVICYVHCTIHLFQPLQRLLGQYCTSAACLASTAISWLANQQRALTNAACLPPPPPPPLPKAAASSSSSKQQQHGQGSTLPTRLFWPCQGSHGVAERVAELERVQDSLNAYCRRADADKGSAAPRTASSESVAN